MTVDGKAGETFDGATGVTVDGATGVTVDGAIGVAVEGRIGETVDDTAGAFGSWTVISFTTKIGTGGSAFFKNRRSLARIPTYLP